MQQMTFIPKTTETPTIRPGRDALRERLSAVAPQPEPAATGTDELEDPTTILRALIADLEEAIEIGKQMDADLMTMLHGIVPAQETRS